MIFPDLAWGTANAGHGIRVTADGTVGYTTLPTINNGLGAGRETLIGGVDTNYAAIAPNVTSPNGAKIVLRA